MEISLSCMLFNSSGGSTLIFDWLEGPGMATTGSITVGGGISVISSSVLVISAGSSLIIKGGMSFSSCSSVIPPSLAWTEISFTLASTVISSVMDISGSSV